MKTAESLKKSFNYAIGMFGTSIPINMLKTYAAIYYGNTCWRTEPTNVEKLGDELWIGVKG